MNPIYFDNAATTAIDSRVLDTMLPYLKEFYGNPSAIHGAGRKTRLAIEESRKKVASLLSCKPAEIFFTSCGTESTNTALQGAVRNLDCKHIITSPIEHHATLHTAAMLNRELGVQIHFCKHNESGEIDYNQFTDLLNEVKGQGKTLVSIMHANNELGIINDIEKIGALCKERAILFHSDMVQTIGHLPIELDKLAVDFVSASAHKFHGPKGLGALYIHGALKLEPLIYGGGQERNMRAGTEDVAGIVGFAKALELSIAEMVKENKHCAALKEYCWSQLKQITDAVALSTSSLNTLPRVLSVLFPLDAKTEMLQMALDIKGIALSGGSACSSGAMGGSHVMNHVQTKACVPLRISFCKSNTMKEVDIFIKALNELLN